MPKNRTLPILIIALAPPLWALAQPEAPAPAPAPPATAIPAPEPAAKTADEPAKATEAEAAIDAAIPKLRAIPSASAEIFQKADMLGQHFTLKGRYVKAPGHRLRLELALAGLGDATGSMLQVCDGQTRWDYYQILESKSYRKLDFAKILKRLEGPEFDATYRDFVLSQLGFAGPDALLAGLRKAIEFDQKEEGTLEGKAVWVIRGKWKDQQALDGSKPNAPPGAPNINLPPYVPSVATLWLGREDGWPYQVVLEGRARSVLDDDRPKGEDGRPIGPQKPVRQDQPSKLTLTYSNVKLNPEIDPKLFTYQIPDDAKGVADETDDRLTELEQAALSRLAEKKEEAAKEADDLIDQPIAVPKLDPDESSLPPGKITPIVPPR